MARFHETSPVQLGSMICDLGFWAGEDGVGRERLGVMVRTWTMGR